MDDLTSSVQMHLHSGIPVVDVCGEWTLGIQSALIETVQFLTRRAHLDIILNMQRAHIFLDEFQITKSLDECARCVREHYGRVELVVTAEQNQWLNQFRPSAFGMRALKEEEAVCRIKGVLLGVQGIITKGWFASGSG